MPIKKSKKKIYKVTVALNSVVEFNRQLTWCYKNAGEDRFETNWAHNNRDLTTITFHFKRRSNAMLFSLKFSGSALNN